LCFAPPPPEPLTRRRLVIVAVAGLIGVCLWPAARAGWAWRHWYAAQRLVELREFDGARIHIDACLEHWPASAQVRILAARNARLRKDPAEAFRLLNEAQRLDGNIERIVLERYLLRAERGEMAQVEKQLLAFLAKDDADALVIRDTLTYQWMMADRFT